MTQEEEILLLQDICGRLPYKVKGLHRKQVHTITNIEPNSMYPSIKVDGYDAWFPIEMFKPYLRPMSSMTEEEKEHLQSLHNIISDENYEDGYSPAAWETISEFDDYCHEHHLDNRGLISKGLAIKAPEGMYAI